MPSPYSKNAAAEALRAIRGLAGANRITYTGHARQRMQERNITRADVRAALSNASACKVEPNDRWKATGTDLDGDELTVVVVIEGELLVVTLY